LALLLQEDGYEVTATEVIPEAVQIMKERGVRDARLSPLEDLPLNRDFDTILLLMNGIALAGTLRGFPRLLETLRRLLRPGGQVLIDSTDLPKRLWDETREPAVGPLHGGEDGPIELHYQVEFEGVKGEPFPQLFLDPGSLMALCQAEGWEAEVLLSIDGGEYLARLTAPGHPSGP
jgi:SAM-dependent methyltransferase